MKIEIVRTTETVINEIEDYGYEPATIYKIFLKSVKMGETMRITLADAYQAKQLRGGLRYHAWKRRHSFDAFTDRNILRITKKQETKGED